MTRPGWDHERRARYAGLADVLIPAFEDLPSASSADVATHWIDVALVARPDLHELFFMALDEAVAEPGHAVEYLMAKFPAAFAALGNLTAAAYFMNEHVRQLVGYPGQVTRDYVDEVPLYLEMLERVVERGSIYRPTPSAADHGTSGATRSP